MANGTLEKELAIEYPLGITEAPYTPIVSDATRYLVWYILDTCVSSILSYVGVVCNLLTLIAFVKMGFQDTINISLTHLVFWDLFRATAYALHRARAIVSLVDEALGITWNVVGFYYISFIGSTGGVMAGLLTGYVTVERCLCVSLPFTVKYLITRRFVIIVNSSIIAVVLVSNFSCYVNLKFLYVIHPLLNETVGTIKWSNAVPELNALLNITAVLYQVIPFSTMCVCTVIISYHLRKFSKFRAQATISAEKTDSSKSMTLRDKKVMKMLLVILIVYLITAFPRIFLYLVREIFPDFDDGGRDENVLHILATVKAVCNCINFVANPFIFYFMSSQFNKVFNSIFKPKCF